MYLLIFLKKEASLWGLNALFYMLFRDDNARSAELLTVNTMDKDGNEYEEQWVVPDILDYLLEKEIDAFCNGKRGGAANIITG